MAILFRWRRFWWYNWQNVATEFKKDNGIDLKSDKLALQRLKEAAEKAKIELSSAAQTEINLPFITADKSGPKHLNLKFTRAKLEALVQSLVDRTRTMQNSLKIRFFCSRN